MTIINGHQCRIQDDFRAVLDELDPEDLNILRRYYHCKVDEQTPRNMYVVVSTANMPPSQDKSLHQRLWEWWQQTRNDGDYHHYPTAQHQPSIDYLNQYYDYGQDDGYLTATGSDDEGYFTADDTVYGDDNDVPHYHRKVGDRPRTDAISPSPRYKVPQHRFITTSNVTTATGSRSGSSDNTRRRKRCSVVLYRRNPDIPSREEIYLGLQKHYAHETLPQKCTFPKGGFEDNETAQQCAERELQEETGMSIDLTLGEHPSSQSRQPPAEVAYRVYMMKHRQTGNVTFIVHVLDWRVMKKISKPSGELKWHGWVDLELARAGKMKSCPNGFNARYKESLEYFEKWYRETFTRKAISPQQDTTRASRRHNKSTR